MAFKLIVLCALAAIAASNDLLSGSTSTYQRLIFEQTFDYKPSVYIRSENVNIDTFGDETISKIEVVDNRELKDGIASIDAGGVGQKSVGISLKGPAIFRGMNFTVRVWATNTESKSNVNANLQAPGRYIENAYRKFKEEYEGVKGVQGNSDNLKDYRTKSGSVNVPDDRDVANVERVGEYAEKSGNNYGVKGIREDQVEDTRAYYTKH